MASVGLVEGRAGAGTQYEPEVYQPTGQVPTLTTGVVSNNNSRNAPVMNALNGEYYSSTPPVAAACCSLYNFTRAR